MTREELRGLTKGALIRIIKDFESRACESCKHISNKVQSRPTNYCNIIGEYISNKNISKLKCSEWEKKQ